MVWTVLNFEHLSNHHIKLCIIFVLFQRLDILPQCTLRWKHSCLKLQKFCPNILYFLWRLQRKIIWLLIQRLVRLWWGSRFKVKFTFYNLGIFSQASRSGRCFYSYSDFFVKIAVNSRIEIGHSHQFLNQGNLKTTIIFIYFWIRTIWTDYRFYQLF